MNNDTRRPGDDIRALRERIARGDIDFPEVTL